MSEFISQQEPELMLALQRGLPLEPRPFLPLAERLSMIEDEVLARIRHFLDQGTARRFGAVFDSRGLGYASTLCAASVPHDDLGRVTALLHPHPGITHCYEREGDPNLWFTMTAPAEQLDAELGELGAALTPYELHNLPALRRFKIDVVFDTRQGVPQDVAQEPMGRPSAEPLKLGERERALVRAIQGMLPLVPEPFAAVADELGCGHEDVLSILKGWKERGVLRRVALIVRHRRIGFEVNGMCVWRVDSACVEAAGKRLAAFPAVTHCYERPSFEAFPFNLFAMIHAGTKEEALKIREQISAAAGLEDGRMLVSTREFKKSSPIFFCEEGTLRRNDE